MAQPPADEDEATERTPLQPHERRESAVDILSIGPRRPSFASGSMPTAIEPSFNIRRSSVATIRVVKPMVSLVENVADEEPPAPPPSKAFTRDVVLWIVQLTLMSYNQMAFGTMMPIFLIDEPRHPSSLDLYGGLGYSVRDVGTFMSVNGLISMAIQILIFPVFVAKVGVWRSIIIPTILCPLVYLVVPFLTLLPRPILPAGIYILIAINNFFMIVIYPCILIALKNVTPSPLMLGRVNGLAMSACSGARTVAPPLAGIFYSAAGSAASWWSTCGFAVITIVELYWLKRPQGLR